jgi:hypothetical protein
MNKSALSGTVTSTTLKNLPSLFFVSLPKSGTVYTWYSLQDTTGLKLPDFHLLEGWNDYNAGRDFSCIDLYACGDYNTQLLVPQGMKNFLRGYIFGSHMQASYHNMRILKESGIDKITVLLRDPRDAFVSWVHHLNKLGPSARNYHSKIYHIPRSYYAWSLEEQFSYQIRTFLPITVNWVEGWLDYYASADKEIEILFVYYDELKRQPERYFRRITEFHGLKDVDFSKVVKAEPGKMHFRKGEHEQWRNDFSAADQSLVENLMQDRILRGFDAAAAAHPALISAKESLAAGQAQKVLTDSVKTLMQFPNYYPAYDLFLTAAEQSNLNVSTLRRQIETELASQSTSNAFIYRYELVDSCTNLAQTLSRD